MLRVLARLVLIPVGVALAALAALLVGSVGAANWGYGDNVAEFLAATGLALALHATLGGEPEAAAHVMTGLLLVSGGVVVVPVALMAILGELFGLTSWLTYVLGTGLLFAAVPVLLPGDPAAPGEWRDIGLGFAAAGFAAGLVYWFIAGRGARPASRDVEADPAAGEAAGAAGADRALSLPG